MPVIFRRSFTAAGVGGPSVFIFGMTVAFCSRLTAAPNLKPILRITYAHDEGNAFANFERVGGRMGLN